MAYGSYDLPFGKGKQFVAGANHAADLLIGGYQLSTVFNWSSGLPFSLGYSNFGNNEDCNHDTGGSAAPCRPNANGHLSTSLSGPVFHALSATDTAHGTITKSYFTPNPSIFSFPGLDKIGNGGANNYFGPGYFQTDLTLTKAFNIWESVNTSFRVDAFNVFNHINSGNPYNTDIFGTTSGGGPINNSGGGSAGTPRYLEFSLRVAF